MAKSEDDLDAAERAIGTLPRDGEGPAGARRRLAWEKRLAPLAELVAPVPPPETLLGRVMERIGEEEADRTARALARERRRAARWRGAAAALGAAAAVATVVSLVGQPAPGPDPVAPPPVPEPVAPAPVEVPVAPARIPDFVSVATTGSGQPLLAISLADGVATVQPVALTTPLSGSLELWHLPQGGAPVSLGLIDPAQPMEVALTAASGDAAAVSLEAAGGSPSGQPTGQMLGSGPFIGLR